MANKPAIRRKKGLFLLVRYIDLKEPEQAQLGQAVVSYQQSANSAVHHKPVQLSLQMSEQMENATQSATRLHIHAMSRGCRFIASWHEGKKKLVNLCHGMMASLESPGKELV